VGAPEGEVTILLTGDAEVRELNRRFRRKDRATDVLSFPDGVVGPEEPPRIGDIVISVPAAARNAKRLGHSLRREILHLLIHGFLHLMGFDHEVDGGDMERLEAQVRGSLLRREREEVAG
jgi:probable rRNA maturation factor